MTGTPPLPNFDERVQLNHAVQLARAGRIAEAELVFGDLLRRDPNSIEANSFLATRAFEQQCFREVATGGEITLGADNPTVEWMLKQRLFSLEDAIARQPGLDRQELRRDLEQLARAGVIVETEMR